MFNGIINFEKPIGLTSTDCVSFVKRLFRGAKVGHGGTLDPLASGVLPIGVGSGTKLLSSFLDGDKEYSGSFRLFVSTDTLDSEGHIIELRENTGVDTARILRDAGKFNGTYEQQTPIYSARRVGGTRLYDLARRNMEIPALATRPVQISDLQLSVLTSETFSFQVTCSKGTYIRQLIKDILAESGNIGVLEELTRRRVANLHLSQAISFGQLFLLVANQQTLAGSAFHCL